MNADGTVNESVARAKLSTVVSADKTSEILNACKALSKFR